MATLLAATLIATPATADRGAVGECIADGWYGNEPNMASGTLGGPQEQAPGTQAGNVLPSQSPGPFVNNPNDPTNPTFGTTVGDVVSQVGGQVLIDYCEDVYG
jgi:hypothetical protein